MVDHIEVGRREEADFGKVSGHIYLIGEGVVVGEEFVAHAVAEYCGWFGGLGLRYYDQGENQSKEVSHLSTVTEHTSSFYL